MDAKNLLLAALVILAIVYLTFWYTTVRRRRAALGPAAPDLTPSPIMIFIGFVTNFFDTLGIGSYATTTSMRAPRCSTASSASSSRATCSGAGSIH